MKKIWILTLFPEYFLPLKNCGVIGSALSGERGEVKLELQLVNIRDFSPFTYKNVDDSPYAGGPGMVMRADVLKNALFEGVIKAGGYQSIEDLAVIMPMPRGKKWSTGEAKKFAKEHFFNHKDLVFIAGRYEGVDERFIERYVTEMYSIGDFILSGGEIAVMALIDSALRFVPGVLGNKESLKEESFEDSLLENPLYTKPLEFEGLLVPEILVSGHHEKIQQYKVEEKIRMTKKYRPDLWEQKVKKND
jgi:tRNA (guanine37-N1)-methyltransferase